MFKSHISRRRSNISAGMINSNVKSFSELADEILVASNPYKDNADDSNFKIPRKRTELNICEDYSTEVYEMENYLNGDVENSPKKLSKIEIVQDPFNNEDDDEENSQSDKEDWDLRNEELMIEELNNIHMNAAENDDDEEIHNVNKSFEGQFNILQLILNKIQSNESLVLNQFEDQTPLTKLNHSTTGKLSKSLKDLFAENRIHKNIMDPLMAVLKQHIPEVNWPIKDNYNGNVKNSIYAKESDYRMLEFHVCPDQACCAFVADYSNHIMCSALRFTK